ncbi:MAG: ABC transporter ATP-binding protein [Desulfurococcales archaeon]|nr:ABC transporter ATP-binding protein [Desulfurococcales archaeon]
MERLVVLDDVWKRYYGGVVALRGVSLHVDAGEVVGLAGPNGAGKTTTMRIIVGLVRPDRGRVVVAGSEPWRGGPRLRRLLGYLPEEAGVYKHMTGMEFLRFSASLYAEDPGEAEEMVRRGAEISGLPLEDLERPMGEYSKGMRRRILLARALMTRPRIVVLDEPTSGIDVEHAVAIRRLVREEARRGAAVLVSSHNLMEMEVLADRVYIISGGRVVAEGRPGELMERYGAETLEEVYLKAVGV